MAFRISWTETAAHDLRGIVEFINLANPDAAQRLAELILSKIENLTKLPKLGRVVPEKNDSNIRELVLSPYRIIYHVEQEHKILHITRIWHSARGIPEL